MDSSSVSRHALPVALVSCLLTACASPTATPTPMPTPTVGEPEPEDEWLERPGAETYELPWLVYDLLEDVEDGYYQDGDFGERQSQTANAIIDDGLMSLMAW